MFFDGAEVPGPLREEREEDVEGEMLLVGGGGGGAR